MAIDGDIFIDYEDDGCSLEGKFNNRFDTAAVGGVSKEDIGEGFQISGVKCKCGLKHVIILFVN